MNLKKVWAVYFSATGTTKKATESIAKVIAQKLEAEYSVYDFTLPASRMKALSFHAEDLVVFGTPVYAGRVPNVLLKYLETIEGNAATAVPVVLYGNRDYDDGLVELRDLLEKANLHTIAAAAYIGEHSFSYILAKGRPDEADMQALNDFAGKIAEKVQGFADVSGMEPIPVKGIQDPYRGYYQPRDRKGNPVDIRKVKPLTNEACDNCMICADVCPMGSINRDDVRDITGICIKCGACIKKCPLHAKYYKDEAFLYHQHELEEGYTRRAEPDWFL
ncbi:MAG TPA: EFR1 family ferrodoxin [Anaerovoracaceae bacterium]|nr:EFR1 family ferrodoxin [Anaerovoracaceae bacterium]